MNTSKRLRMSYNLFLSPYFSKQLNKIAKKDKILLGRINNKLKELKRNPEHYKPLRNVLKGKRATHINPFVIIFEVKENTIILHYIKHHDNAY